MALKKRDMGLVPFGYWGPVSMMREMERMFDDFGRGGSDLNLTPSGSRLPAIDIRDDGGNYQVEAELPGLTKQEVTIELDDDVLVIKADKETSNEEKGEGFVRRERGRMSFYRQVSLPAEVDAAKATAKMEDGVLKVVLPKKERVESKKTLDIQ